MTNLAERLRQIERNPSPDLWGEIASRPVESSPSERHGLRHRVAAGLVAAVVSIAAFAFLVTVFRSGPDRDPIEAPLAPLSIRVWTTEDPGDLHFSATFQGEEIELVGIETPGSDLEYPNSASTDLPVGTPIVVEASDALSVSVFELDPAQSKFVVENGSCIIPGSLRSLPGPGETAFFVYAEGEGFSGGQAFRAETIGEGLDHDSALDPDSNVDAGKLGLATCHEAPRILVSSSGPSGDQALLAGTLMAQNGCLAVSNDDSPVYVVWPDGYALEEEGDEAWLVDDSGNRIAKVGDQIQVGGGITNLAHAEPSVPDGIPRSCEVSGPDAYWFAGTPELIQPSASPTASEEQFFVPPTSTAGATTTLPLIFPEGSRAEISYPADLLLAERGLAPNLLMHLDRGDRCGWDGIIGYGSLRNAVYEGSGPTFSVDGASSHVEIWEGAQGYLPQYLVIQEGAWEVAIPCPRSDRIPDEASAWADHLKLTESPEGYLVIRSSPPLTIDGPEAGMSYLGPELYFLGAKTVEGATGILSIGVATRCPEGEGVERQPGWARRCFQTDGGAVIMTIQTEGNRPAERAYLDAVVEGVDVTEVTMAAVG